jgi:hypothetical protein
LLIHPDTSRTYDFWQCIVLLAYLTEFVLMPYVTCTDVESQIYDDDKSKSIIFYIEVTIDIILALNILFNFVTAVKIDLAYREEWTKIAYSYVG